jgi:hypothetical protein
MTKRTKVRTEAQRQAAKKVFVAAVAEVDKLEEDEELIKHCIEAGQCLAAYRASWDCDPDDNSKFANVLSEPFERRRKKAIVAATELQAHTVSGLSAKARLATALIEYEVADAYGDRTVVFDTEAAKFLQEFAVDTKRMMRALAEAPGLVLGVKH